MPSPIPPMKPYPRYTSHSWSVATPSAPIAKPLDQHTAAVNIALRGPTRSTHVPSTAADRPSITMAMLKMAPIAVRLESKCSTSGFLNTLKRVDLADREMNREGRRRDQPTVVATRRDRPLTIQERQAHASAPLPKERCNTASPGRC